MEPIGPIGGSPLRPLLVAFGGEPQSGLYSGFITRSKVRQIAFPPEGSNL